VSLNAILLHGGVYLLTGTVAGLLAGLLGIGGGVVLVPAFFYIFSQNSIFPQDLVMHMAVGTSLAVILFTTLSTIYAYYKRDVIRWDLFHRLWPGIAIGVVCGATIAHWLPTQKLQILFGIFLLIVSMKMLFDQRKTQVDFYGFPRPWLNGLISFISGCLSGLFGVGGGALIIPYLHYCGVEMRQIIPISALGGFTVAVIGTVIFIVMGFPKTNLPPFTTGAIYWPAVICVAIPGIIFTPIGAKLAYNLPVKQLRYVFIFFLLLTAIMLLR
jgi:uncharacterized protein